jgi:hypothetical protein
VYHSLNASGVLVPFLALQVGTEHFYCIGNETRFKGVFSSFREKFILKNVLEIFRKLLWMAICIN